MDDSDGSARAAQSAQPFRQDKGFWNWFRFGRGDRESARHEQVGASQTQSLIRQPDHIGMMNLRRKRVEDVAIPKAEIVSVSDTISRDDLAAVFRDSGLTRLPVYSGTLDTPVGMAHLKDFALKYGFDALSDEFELAPMLRPLLYVPLSMPIGVLLTKMQTERRHMALVIDEYGGVDGLVTIEDLIEQIIGDIEDEHDLEEDSF